MTARPCLLLHHKRYALGCQVLFCYNYFMNTSRLYIIQKMVNSGLSQSEVGRKLGISRQYVSSLYNLKPHGVYIKQYKSEYRIKVMKQP